MVSCRLSGFRGIGAIRQPSTCGWVPAGISRHRERFSVGILIRVGWADLGDHGLGPGPVPGVAAVTASGVVFVIAEMVVHLDFEAGL